MTLSVYETLRVTLNRNLDVVDHLLDQAAASAQARSFDIGVLLNARLAPDMLPLIRQVQLISDMGKGMAGRLSGTTLPVFEDVETTLPELKQRIARTREFVNSIDPASFAGAEDREITIPTRAEALRFKGLDYLLSFALPNFYFHVSAVYMILRHNGVELGKRDFLGLR
ncbi:hypothetical protein DFR29_11030 [Tahibacter aquaticus]|jgi:hypothetical protein|uniref:DUF1993 domain-containing protein n=1 Tax=Tahibacter aquaticus TaxID=520092 RepID=A0A4R6YT93_9GAMM|nr:DUF1993 domain-containing protein [Tahibacter aquaticus]TDR41548.1 hypothetical protein DFR29_11030 [Tahibacter aquaticus]